MLGEQCPRCLSSAFEPVKSLLPEDVPKCGFCVNARVVKYAASRKVTLNVGAPLSPLKLVEVRFDDAT